MTEGARRRRSRGEEGVGETAYQVIERLLGRNYRRGKLRAEDLGALRQGLAEGDADRLLELVRDDTSLARTKRLLTLVARASREKVQVSTGGPSPVPRDLVIVHADVLALLERLGAASSGVGPWFRARVKAFADEEPGQAPRATKGSKKARENAAWCVLAMMAVKGVLDSDSALRFARRHLWSRSSPSGKSLEWFGHLAGSEAGVVLLDEISRLEREWGSEKEELRMMEGRLAERRRTVLEAEGRLKEKEAEIVRGKENLAEERELTQQLRDELVQTVANERRRLGSLLRNLRANRDLLDDGLHALSQADPRVHVMVDHGERAVASLREGIDRIERAMNSSRGER